MCMLNEDAYKRKLAKIKKYNEHKKYRQELIKELNLYSNKGKIETSKLMAVYLIILLNVIIIYSMIVMWRFQDLTYLGVLISDIAAQVLIYAIYCLKAYNGKKQEELIKFRRDRYFGTLSEVLDAGSNCEESVPLTKGVIEPTNNGTYG